MVGRILGNKNATLHPILGGENGRFSLGRLLLVLFFFWPIGFLQHFGGGLIHILVIVVLVLIVFNLLKGRGAPV